MSSGQQQNKWFYKCWYACCFLFVLVFVVLAFFNHPHSDDYLLGYFRASKNFWQLQRELYMTWQGRYFTNLLIPGWVSYSLQQNLYWLHPLFLLLASFLALRDLVKQWANANQLSLAKGPLFFISSLLLLTMIFTMPSVQEGYYWLTGALAYQPGFILLLLIVSLYFRMASLPPQKRRGYLWLAVFLSVLLAGSIEIVLLIALLLLLYWWCFVNRRDLRKEMLVITAVVLLGSLITMFAPGTLNRTASMSGGWLAAFVSFAYWPLKAITSVAAQPVFWATCMVAFVLGATFKSSDQVVETDRRSWIALLLLPMLALLPILLVSSGSLPLRVLNVVTQSWVLLLVAFSFRMGTSTSLPSQSLKIFFTARWILPLLVVTSMLAGGYFRNLLQGYFYDQVMLRNESLLKASGGKDASMEREYKKAVANVYQQVSPALQKNLVWDTVQDVPELIGDYTDFENFNGQGPIALYYQSVYR